MRSRGLLPHELAQIHREDKSQRINRLRQGVKVDTGDALLSRDSSAAGLARDYADLADEVLASIAHRDGAIRVEVAV
jgi:hypothetical protein